MTGQQSKLVRIGGQLIAVTRLADGSVYIAGARVFDPLAEVDADTLDEVQRLRTVLDGLLELLAAQISGGPPAKMPQTWTRSEVAHYRHGWLDAMQRIDDSIVSVDIATGGGMGKNWREGAEDRWAKVQAEHERLREAMAGLLAAVANEGVKDCSPNDLYAWADTLDAQNLNLHARWVRRIADAAAAARGEGTDG